MFCALLFYLQDKICPTNRILMRDKKLVNKLNLFIRMQCLTAYGFECLKTRYRTILTNNGICRICNMNVTSQFSYKG